MSVCHCLPVERPVPPRTTALRKALVVLAGLTFVGGLLIESYLLAASAWFAASMLAPAVVTAVARHVARSWLARATFGFAPGKLTALVEHTCAVMFVLGAMAIGTAAGRSLLLGGPALAVVDAVAGLAVLVPTLVACVARSRHALRELVDMDPGGAVQRQVRALLPLPIQEVRVWSLGTGMYGCTATLHGGPELDLAACREKILAMGHVAHVTLEVRPPT